MQLDDRLPLFNHISNGTEKVFSVSEISRGIKNALEQGFAYVKVKGEASGIKVHTSGHVYFSLKDETNVLDAICWKGSYLKVKIKPEDGMEVTCTGKITTYPGRSKYQIIVDTIEIEGEGQLLKQLEERKRRFAAEGLFAQERKKPLPFLPRKIGVITSPTGAVIKDILHRIEDRFPTHIMLWPVLVQGVGAAEQVAAAINGFNALADPPDILIVARGGGSLEDLWCFNEEIVVRATANSRIPIISAIGHETDTTLIDYAADRRAPTPTAAAEMAVPVRMELVHAVNDRTKRLQIGIGRYLDEYVQKLDDWSERMTNAMRYVLQYKTGLASQISARIRHPREIVSFTEQRLVQSNKLWERAWQAYVSVLDNRLITASKLLESYSYNVTLARGFAIVKAKDGKVISSCRDAVSNTPVNMVFIDGEVEAVVS